MGKKKDAIIAEFKKMQGEILNGWDKVDDYGLSKKQCRAFATGLAMGFCYAWGRVSGELDYSDGDGIECLEASLSTYSEMLEAEKFFDNLSDEEREALEGLANAVKSALQDVFGEDAV